MKRSSSVVEIEHPRSSDFSVPITSVFIPKNVHIQEKPDNDVKNLPQYSEIFDVSNTPIDLVMPKPSFNNLSCYVKFLNFPAHWPKQFKSQKESKYIVRWDGRSQYLLDLNVSPSKDSGHVPSYKSLGLIPRQQSISRLISQDTMVDDFELYKRKEILVFCAQYLGFLRMVT